MTRPSPPTHAICREVPASYSDCLRESGASIDVEKAREQHARYVEVLQRLGVSVTVFPPLDDLPDSVFVEDVAVITGRHTLLTNPGAPSRRGEVAAMREALTTHFTIHETDDGAFLDGGDVLRVGDRLFVGLSNRTNEAGAAALERGAGLDDLRVVPVRVRHGLHLKSACTALDDRTVIQRAAAFDSDELERHEVCGVEAPEPSGTNILVLADSVLVPASAPRTAERLSDSGWNVLTLDISEFQTGDGALSCLSLRWRTEDGWVV